MKSSAKKKRRAAKKKRPRRRRDRLSGLPDAILGHVLSFLPAEEAGRATILSRCWRNTFADVVHTISFRTPASCLNNSSGSNPDQTVHGKLLDQVTAALLARRRHGDGGDEEARLRCLRVAMHGYGVGSPWLVSWRDSSAVDQWLSYALTHGVQELYLQTSTRHHDMICQLCSGQGRSYSDIDDGSDTDSNTDSDSSDSESSDTESEEEDVKYPIPNRHINSYDVPAKLFSCATLQSLHLVSCSLPPNLASTIQLPSLDTLALSNISYSVSARHIQLLISGCPRLADLTLEACHQIKDITLNNRLRSFALRCCHAVRRVTIDLSEARAFEYAGPVPSASCFTLVSGGLLTMVSAKIKVIRRANSGKVDLESLRGFLLLFVNVKHLHLGWPNVTRNSRSEYSKFFSSFPGFHNLTRLELGNRCAHPRAVDAVTGILRQTPNLTALSLKLGHHKSDGNAHNPCFAVDVPDVLPVRCLRERVREISVEQYEGAKMQRVLLKALLREALVLESVGVVFASGRYSLDVLVDEIKSWPANPATRVTLQTL